MSGPTSPVPEAIRRITFVGVRAGHGTSTIASAAAMYWAERELVQLGGGSAGDLAALLGVTEPAAGGSVAVAAGLTLAAAVDADESTAVVVDAGACRSDAVVATTRPGEAVLGVLRGPCYLGLQTLGRLDTTGWAGLVLVRESGRALDRRDVEDIGGIPVLAAVEVSPVVARVLDSGLALGRLGAMREFAELHVAFGKLIERPMSTIDRVLARHGRTRTEPCESTYTDWRLPPMAEGATKVTVAIVIGSGERPAADLASLESKMGCEAIRCTAKLCELGSTFGSPSQDAVPPLRGRE